ncbi:MAG TPA: hypothetical protein VN867_11065, partial [Candidatus Binataceae bacterium]|nr:hypothetical protein [Candidatus Binataceae bacterium]
MSKDGTMPHDLNRAAILEFIFELLFIPIYIAVLKQYFDWTRLSIATTCMLSVVIFWRTLRRVASWRNQR